MNKLVIIGSGPAALTAAIYAARAGIETVVYERGSVGGALAEIAHIANFPGFVGTGNDLADNLRRQALEAGARVEYGECTKIAKEGSNFELIIDGMEVVADAVLFATGSEPKKLELDTKKPISYCVLCDAPLYKDKDVLVIGGGNSAIGEAIYLADIAKTVTVINRSALRAEKALQDKLLSHKNAKIVENVTDFTPYIEEAAGIFVLIGKQPASGIIRDFSADLVSEEGYIITNNDNMTSVSGIFAAGDVRQGSTKQAITAAADGAVAAIGIKNYLKSLEN